MTRAKQNLSRRSPLSPEQVATLRAGILALITITPQTCVGLATLYGRNEKTLMNHLRAMRELGQIHAKRTGPNPRDPYEWRLGPGAGDAVEPRRYKQKPHASEQPRQERVTSWPPVQVKPQHIWSSVMG